MKPTIYVKMESEPLQKAMAMIANAEGVATDELRDENGIEADLVITSSVALATELHNKTEKAVVVLACYGETQTATAATLAAHFPRLIIGAMVSNGENIVTRLCRVTKKMATEGPPSIGGRLRAKRRGLLEELGEVNQLLEELKEIARLEADAAQRKANILNRIKC